VRVGPFFKCFGSKWQSARRYPKPRERIYEWFAGGAGYSCNYSDRAVTLIERHPELVELWWWLINDARPEDVLAIPLGLPVGTDIRDLPNATAGQKLLLKWWQRTNNFSTKPGSWTISPWGNKPGQWTESTRTRIARELEFIRHWRIDCYDYLDRIRIDQIRSIDTKQCTVFVDPPYQHNYQYSAPRLDYPVLASACLAAADSGAAVIVCEAAGKNGEAPDWLPFAPSHLSVTSRRKAEQSHHSKEYIWTSGRAAE
jgi:site-specific DNA-adenine methylase